MNQNLNINFELNDLINNMVEGLVIHNADGSISFFNKTTLNILGLTEDQILGKTSFDPQWKCFKEDGSPMTGEDHPSSIAMKTGKQCLNQIMNIHLPNGNQKWLLINANPIKKDHVIQKIIVTFNDITIQKLQEFDLISLKERLEVAIKNLNFGIWDWNLKTNHLYWDDHMYEIFGVKKENFNYAYEAFEQCLNEGESEKVNRELERTFKNKQDFDFEFNIKKPTGEIRLIKANAKAYYGPEGEILRLVGANWDITNEREQYLKFMQASKMNSLGEMSAGLAHEINNPLAIIAGYLDLMDKYIKSDNTTLAFETLAKLKNNVLRITKIINSLRKFSRQEKNQLKENVKIKKVIDESLDLVESLIKNKGISLVILDQTNSMVNICQSEIEQALINLFHNSINAIEDMKQPWIKVLINETDHEIELSFMDSGKGIPDHIAHRIFEPFFTTKEVGKGTGLGLPITKGLIESNNGQIYYDDSSPFTKFVIKFPKVEN